MLIEEQRPDTTESKSILPEGDQQDFRVNESLAQLRRALSPVASTPGLQLEFRSARTPASGLFAPITKPAGEPVLRIGVDAGPDSELLVYYPESSGPTLNLVEMAIRNVVERLEAERREELLVDQLGTSGLQRLIDRFASIQPDLNSGLFLTRHGRLEAIAGTVRGCPPLDWADLGILERAARAGEPILLNQIPAETPETAAPWTRAVRLASAPLISRQKVIGFLAVWRNDAQIEFGLPFARLLDAVAGQANILLESDRHHRTMRENERLAQEIEIASSIQETLLFGNPPGALPGLEIASFSAASQRIDGDFHDFLQQSERSIDVLIGDVMGKGVAAALLGAAAKNQFLRSIANLASHTRGGPPSPAEIAAMTARRIEAQLLMLERFITICYARFDLDQGLLEFVDCGHTGIILHRKHNGETRFLRGEDLPIGIRPGFECSQQTTSILPGDTFLLFSDGITETRNREGELFGEARLFDSLERWSALGAGILLGEIRKRLTAFAGEQRQSDDLTCIAVTVRADQGTPSLAAWSEQFSSSLDEVARLREWVDGVAEGLPGGGLDCDGVLRLELSCTEAFTNCVNHGSAEGAPSAIEISARCFENYVNFEIRHGGPAFDPLSVPEPAFDGSQDCGFGTYIIFRCADELSYRREGDTNLISISILRKRTSHGINDHKD